MMVTGRLTTWKQLPQKAQLPWTMELRPVNHATARRVVYHTGISLKSMEVKMEEAHLYAAMDIPKAFVARMLRAEGAQITTAAIMEDIELYKV